VAKKYDVVMKKLVERDPAAWLESLGIETDGPIGIVDADLSKITSEADRIVLVESSEPHLVHIEFHSTRDHDLAERLLINNVNIGFELKRRLESHAILLHPSVDSSELTGLFRKSTPDGDPVLDFRYRVVRAWTLPVEPLLTGDIQVTPLAPLANVAENTVAEIIRRVDSRLSSETEPSTAHRIMETTLVLAGLRLGEKTIRHFRETLKSMTALKDPSYSRPVDGKGLEKGREEGLKKGRKKRLEK
jgi:predicted transposase YdaD